MANIHKVTQKGFETLQSQVIELEEQIKQARLPGGNRSVIPSLTMTLLRKRGLLETVEIEQTPPRHRFNIVHPDDVVTLAEVAGDVQFEEETYTVLGSPDGDPSNGIVSFASPFGRPF